MAFKVGSGGFSHSLWLTCIYLYVIANKQVTFVLAEHLRDGTLSFTLSYLGCRMYA